jgi:HPt (histidine-containing phosphotransfer) domain-containing protein
MKSSAQRGVQTDAALTQAIDRLWIRFLPEIRERVATLEGAAKAVAAGNLTSSRREAAKAAAHKLAGVLGTFSLTRGTVLARELELTFSRESSPTLDAGKHLAAIAADLHSMIESRKSTA